jgi:hypothetical protein
MAERSDAQCGHESSVAALIGQRSVVRMQPIASFRLCPFRPAFLPAQLHLRSHERTVTATAWAGEVGGCGFVWVRLLR